MTDPTISPLQIISAKYQIGLINREIDEGLKAEVFRKLVFQVAEKIIGYYGMEAMSVKVDDELIGGTSFSLDVYVGDPADVEEYALSKARFWIEINQNGELANTNEL